MLWYQVIDKAATDKAPVILVTDDVKDDWWHRFKGRTIGPRPQLIEEMDSKTGMLFYMYQSDQFMEYARGFLRQRVDQQAIDEVREVRTGDEKEISAREVVKRRYMRWKRRRALAWDEIARISERMTHLRSKLDDYETRLRTESIIDEDKPLIAGAIEVLRTEISELIVRNQEAQAELAHIDATMGEMQDYLIKSRRTLLR